MPGVPAACAYPSSHLSHPAAAPDVQHEDGASDVAKEQPTRQLPSSGALPRLDQRPTQDQGAPPEGSTKTSEVMAPDPVLHPVLHRLGQQSAAEACVRLSEQSANVQVWLVCWLWSAATLPLPLPLPLPLYP